MECSTLPAEIKHQLHFVNRWKAWFGREPLTMKDESEIPLRAHDYFVSREGERKKSVQVNERGGRLFFGIVTDVAAAAVRC